MSTVDDILAGLDFDSADGSSRLPFLTKGKYVLLIKKCGINGGFKGTKFFAEMEVIKAEKTTEDDQPTPVGKTVSWIQKIGGKTASDLVGPNNIINFLAAATGYSSALFKSQPADPLKGTPADPMAGKRRIKKLIGDEDGTMPEGPLTKFGVMVTALCYDMTTVTTKKQITPVAYSMLPGFTLADLMAKRKNGEEQATQAQANA